MGAQMQKLLMLGAPVRPGLGEFGNGSGTGHSQMLVGKGGLGGETSLPHTPRLG